MIGHPDAYDTDGEPMYWHEGIGRYERLDDLQDEFARADRSESGDDEHEGEK